MESGWTKSSSVEIVTKLFTFPKLHKSNDTKVGWRYLQPYCASKYSIKWMMPHCHNHQHFWWYQDINPLSIDTLATGAGAACPGSVFTLQLCKSGAVSSRPSLRSQCFYKFNFPILHTSQIFCYPATSSTSDTRLWRLHVISRRIWKVKSISNI